VRKTLKRWVARFPVVYGALKRIRDAIWPPPEDPLKVRLRKLLARKRGVFFIQVGSNDGVQGDPIHELIKKHRDWRGILIEPVPFVFQRLRKNYGESNRISFENVAIGTRRESRPFFYVAEQAKELFSGELPFWYDQLGSFERQHILKHLNGALEPYIISEPVQCVPLEDVLKRNQVERIDLVHIDTEGFDYEVLRQIDFRRFRPAVVLFEHQHLTASDATEAERLLAQHGYSLAKYAGDTLATLAPAH
jgi:FkbM family methyltransferase